MPAQCPTRLPSRHSPGYIYKVALQEVKGRTHTQNHEEWVRYLGIHLRGRQPVPRRGPRGGLLALIRHFHFERILGLTHACRSGQGRVLMRVSLLAHGVVRGDELGLVRALAQGRKRRHDRALELVQISAQVRFLAYKQSHPVV